MSHIMHGIKEVYLAPGSAVFPVDGTGAHGLGYDGKGSLTISAFNPTKGDKGRQFKTYENFKIEKNTHQFAKASLVFLLACLKASDITAKVITSGVSKAANFTSQGGIFTFENANSLGLDLEMELSNTNAFIKLTLEKAFKKAAADAIKTASKTDTLPGALSLPDLDNDALLTGDITPGFGTLIIADDRLSTFKVSLKSVSTKNGMNKSLSSRIAVNIEGVMSGPDPDEIADILDFEIAPDITIAMPVAVPYNLVLKSGGLTKMGEAVIDDDKREGKVMLSGEYDLDFVDTSGSDIVFKAQM